jgi:hypothetical protein
MPFWTPFPDDMSKIPVFSFDGLKMRKARICKIYDGDSITVCVYIRGQYRRLTCRLAELDAAELKGPTAKKGHDARKTLLSYLRVSGDNTCEYTPAFFNTHPFYVDMKCGKNDKYGRVLVHIRPSRTFLRLKYINKALSKEDNFRLYSGGKKIGF